ncbi:MAG: DUF3307 domain-containing protein [Flavobacterium sp.]|nr:DUF3307 domain-containing protein [Flavobacterium sp.]
MIIFIKLLLAHLLGDFIMQPNSWIADKERKKHLSLYLYRHSLIHGALAYLLISDYNFWPYALLLVLIHFAIDLTKLHFQTPLTKRRWFIVDQLLHLASLILIAIMWHKVDLSHYVIDDRFWIVVTGIIFLTIPTSIIVKTIISIWTPSDDSADSDLQHAGKYIGILERLFVFCFIVTGHFEAIGFLLAAKSIFRFGDLTQARDRKLTEYVLIGTLISFAFAVFLGLLTAKLLTEFT